MKWIKRALFRRNHKAPLDKVQLYPTVEVEAIPQDVVNRVNIGQYETKDGETRYSVTLTIDAGEREAYRNMVGCALCDSVSAMRKAERAEV